MAEQQYPNALRLAARFFTIAGFILAVVSLTPIDLWWARMLGGQTNSHTGDVLIVLSGAAFGDGTMGANSYLRSLYAVRNYRPGGFK